MILYRLIGPVITAEEGSIYGYDQDEVLCLDKGTFTRSDGTVMARLYERLTKRSRRRENNLPRRMREKYYRQGVYDAYKELQRELKFND